MGNTLNFEGKVKVQNTNFSEKGREKGEAGEACSILPLRKWVLRNEHEQTLKWKVQLPQLPTEAGGGRGGLNWVSEQEERSSFREGNCPGMGPRMARSHCLFRIDLIFAYWLLHLFLDSATRDSRRGWSALQMGAAIPQERPDFL